MVEGHPCVMCAAMHDAGMVFDHDKTRRAIV
jgi:hypothetical protein